MNAVLVLSLDSRPPQGVLSSYAIPLLRGIAEEGDSQILRLFNLAVLEC